MKRIYTIIFAAAALFTACEEFQPVFTGKYTLPEKEKIYTDADFGGSDNIKTIAEAKALYPGTPIKVTEDFIIKGTVTTSDQEGNLYKTLYIQDETSGIELKIGKNGLYNEYKLGQTIYVNLNGLTVGNYRGMINIGYQKNVGDQYETSYMEHYQIIDSHIFKGELGEPVAPKAITESEVRDPVNFGRLVTLSDLTYSDKLFILAYVDYNGDHKDYANNGIFIDDKWKNEKRILSWAVSEQLWKKHLYSGIFDGVKAGIGTVGSYRREVDDPLTGGKKIVYDISLSAYSMSQYFSMPGGQTIEVRSSGYSKFSDTEIPAEVVNGANVTFTGILSIYDDKYQITLIDLDGVKKSDGTPWYN
jgi:hypothetical protein